jgi:hypothetical protein
MGASAWVALQQLSQPAPEKRVLRTQHRFFLVNAAAHMAGSGTTSSRRMAGGRDMASIPVTMRFGLE